MRTMRAAALIQATVLMAMGSGGLHGQTTERVSVNSKGGEGNAQSQHPSINRTGRLVAFYSEADNLDVDTNGVGDVFVHDRGTGLTILASVSTTSDQGLHKSDSPHIASNGLRVAFRSSADNLVTPDTNGEGDIFVRDLVLQTTVMASVDSAGVQANDGSFAPYMSGDGRFVGFDSSASNLVPGDKNSVRDVFVRDLLLGVTTCVSLDENGGVGANGDCYEVSLSRDGRFAAFYSDADNLVPGDTNGLRDVFVRDRVNGTTLLVSNGRNGVPSNGNSHTCQISDDGRFVVFQSDASNLILGDKNGMFDVYVYEIATGEMRRASQSTDWEEGDLPSFSPVISTTGRWVAFASRATNLVPGDTNGLADIFVRDRLYGLTRRVSLSELGVETDARHDVPSIAGDGHHVVWMSEATNLVDDDTNGVFDVFVRTSARATWENYGQGHPGTLGVPEITLSGNPLLGLERVLTIGNSFTDPTPAVLFLGFAEASIPSSWGSDLLVEPFMALPIRLPIGGIDVPFDIPAMDSLEGVGVWMQALERDPGASHGVSFTPGIRMILGW